MTDHGNINESITDSGRDYEARSDNSMRNARDDGDNIQLHQSYDYGSFRGSSFGHNKNTYTVEQAIEQMGFGKFQLRLSVILGLCWMSDAGELMLLSILGPELVCRWQLEHWQEALITTVVFVGGFIGAPLWGKLADKFGRKRILQIGAIGIFTYAVLCTFSPTLTWMLILRGLFGFYLAATVQANTLYAEFLPAKSRGFWLVFLEFFWIMGVVLEVCLAFIVMPTLGWRPFLLLSAVPVTIFVIGSFMVPESAFFQAASGQRSQAVETLQKVAKVNHKKLPQGKLRVNKLDVKKGTIPDLFCNFTTTVTTLILFFLWFSNAFTYYGVVLLSTELFVPGNSCAAGGSVEEQQCFEGCQVLGRDDYGSLLITTLAEFPGIFVTFLVVDILGRKKTMFGLFTLCGISTFLLWMCTTRTVMTILLFTARAASAGSFQVLYVYTPEVFPTHVRALALGVCNGFSRLGPIVAPFISQVLLQSSPKVAIGSFGITVILSAFASLVLPIETKNRQMESTSKGHEASAADTPVVQTNEEQTNAPAV